MDERYSEEELQKMREELARHEMQNIQDSDLYDILMSGCTGYEQVSDEHVREYYENTFGRKRPC